MAEASNPAARFRLIQHPKTVKKSKVTTVEEELTKYSFNFLMCIRINDDKPSSKSL